MKKYFDGQVSAGFMSIYASRTIARISVAMLGLFLPIFLYQLFDRDIRLVAIYYMIDRFVYLIFLPWGTKLALNKIGIKASMVVSTFWIILYYLLFYITNRLVSGEAVIGSLEDSRMIALFFVLSIFILNARRLLYWVPYHTDFAKFTDNKNRVRQTSLLEASTMFLKAIMPVFAGWIIAVSSYNVLFIFGMLILFASAVPLVNIPNTNERFNWSFVRSVREFFSKKRREMVIAYAGDGAEYVINIIVWPIFIFELLRGNYFQVGALSSLIVIASIFLQFIVGRFGDRGRRDKIIRVGIVFYSIGWIIKIFIQTAFQIFVASTYHNLARIFVRAPFDALYYEEAADEGHFVDEYTVVREMAVNAGGVLAFLAVFLIAPVIGIQWTFMVGAIAALFMNFLIPKKTDKVLEMS